LENIKKLLDFDEKIIWEKTIAKGKRREKNYLITNKRVYNQYYKNALKTFETAPKEYIKLKNDIIIVERKGIEKIVRRNVQSLLGKLLDNVDQVKKAKKEQNPFLTTSEMEAKKQESLSKTQEVIQQAKDFLQNTRKIMLYIKNSPGRKPLLILNKLSYDEVNEVSKILAENNPYFSGVTQNQEASSQYIEQASFPQAHESFQQPTIVRHVISRQPRTQSSQIYPFPQQYDYQDPNLTNIFTPTPLQESIPSQNDFLNSKEKSIEFSNACSLIEISENEYNSLFTCSYCKKELNIYKEKVYKCSGCGVFYHESCLNTIMREGICLNCNNILLW